MNELISIVVPVYNVEKYLGTCVESILKQTYSNIEVILVDDGSTDCSGKMCDYYMGQDERIKVIHKKTEVYLMQETKELYRQKENILRLLIATMW